MNLTERAHTLNARGLDIPFIGAVLDLTNTQVEEILLGGEVEEEGGEGSGEVTIHKSLHVAGERPVKASEELALLPTPDVVTFTLPTRGLIVLYVSALGVLEGGGVVPATLAVYLDGVALSVCNEALEGLLTPATGTRAMLISEVIKTFAEAAPDPARGYGMMLELEAGTHSVELLAQATEPGTPLRIAERLIVVEVLS